MKSIALIHTVKSVADTFEAKLRAGVSQDIKVYNMLDEFLAKNPNEIGEFTIENRNRLLNDVKTAEMTGADVIVTTCSTLTPVIEMIRPFIKAPVIAIDDAMAKKSVTFGPKVLVMATAESTIEPTKNKVAAEAALAGVEVELSEMVLMDAFKAMQSQNMKEHDRILRDRSKEIKGFDCIVLAQASMAHMEAEIEKITGCPTLSSPALCIAQVNEALK